MQSAVRLCDARYALVYRLEGEMLQLVAHHNFSPEALEPFRRTFPHRLSESGTLGAQAMIRGEIIVIDDIECDSGVSEAVRELARSAGYRSVIVVPMMRDGLPLGSIALTRSAEGGGPEPFSHEQIKLLEMFAEHVGIAIENTRLFEEVQARNRDLTALGAVGRAVSSTLDLKVVLKTIVDRAVALSNTDGGSIFYFRSGRFELGETAGLDEGAVARFRKLDISAGQTGLGEAIAQRQPLQVPDILSRPSNPLRDAAIEVGLRAGLIVPLLSGEEPLGALVLQRRTPGAFPEAVVNLMRSFADQSTIALENARLFEEIAQKSRELEIASQHKSQFVANMSHELRTPLAAILGYAELMQEGFYEPLGQKSMDALTRIRSNGKHLLGLINTVLDIAKIESGQFNLNMGEYAIGSIVETVRAATESLAETKKLALKTDVAKSLPFGLGDEQRLTQVLLNLVGNAIKFTDTGEVRVSAAAANGYFAVSVTDTGLGIPADQLMRVFEQFHQVDSSNTKAKGGTGLGLAIAKQIVEMHGGRIWVESTLGKGATFQMELPIRAEFRKAN
jgi:signal transduction histidine kinase